MKEKRSTTAICKDGELFEGDIITSFDLDGHIIEGKIIWNQFLLQWWVVDKNGMYLPHGQLSNFVRNGIRKIKEFSE